MTRICGFIMSWMVFSILVLITSHVRANDVLGCGGFVKSDAALDYSKVQIKVFSKNGALKEYTDCAPNNGYYFVPIFDKGEYTLQISAPKGWSFEQTAITVNIDGKSDACTRGEDINFQFQGFGISGRVNSYGRATGPVGVRVHLVETNRATITQADGDFHFNQVVPGTYTIQIAHAKWRVFKREAKMSVSINHTELPDDSLIVAGYDLTGAVFENDKPLANVIVSVFTRAKTHFASECDTSQMDDTSVTKAATDLTFVCRVTTNANGAFTFPALSPNAYVIVATKTNRAVELEFNARQFDVEIAHTSAVLGQKIFVTAYTINGVVMGSADQTGVGGVKILLNGADACTTDARGRFVLSHLKQSVVRIHPQHADYRFTEPTIEVNANLDEPLTFIPSEYRVCGHVKSDAIETISVKRQENPVTTVKTDNTGKFCVFLPAGNYDVSVDGHEQPSGESTQFFPVSHTLNVGNGPTRVIEFAQIKSTVRGRVKCLDTRACENIVVTMKLRKGSLTFTATVTNAKYLIDNVAPGVYEVTVNDARMCWKQVRHLIDVKNREEIVPEFEQIGFYVSFEVTHATDIVYELVEQNETDRGVFEHVTPSHANKFCLKTSGVYRFTPRGCHVFSVTHVDVDLRVDALERVYLSANKHTHEYAMKFGDRLDLFDLNVKGFGVIKPRVIDELNERVIVYDLMLGDGEEVEIEPLSTRFIFKPKSVIVRGQDDCVRVNSDVMAVEARVLTGKIQPPLAGVTVTLNVGGVQKIDVTDESGTFNLGLIERDAAYKLHAEKESYVISGPDKSGVFYAHKLAEINVIVEDVQSKDSLASVLVSVSGGNDKNYRRNLLTNDHGEVKFTSLSPGDYFIRPVLKEYQFNPVSKLISIREGETVKIRLSGTRVAFSVHGHIHTLCGAGEPDVVVKATSTSHDGKCKNHEEESVSDGGGYYRVRALLPGCSYELAIKGANTSALQIHPIVGDVFNQNLTITTPITKVDLIVSVYCENADLYKTLIVRVRNIRTNDAHKLRVDSQNPSSSHYLASNVPETGVLLFDSIPMDNEHYVVEVDTVSKFTRSQTHGTTFVANVPFKFVAVKYTPTLVVDENDVHKSGNVIVIVLLLVGGCVFYWQFISENVVPVVVAAYERIAANRALLHVDSNPVAMDLEKPTNVKVKLKKKN